MKMQLTKDKKKEKEIYIEMFPVSGDASRCD